MQSSFDYAVIRVVPRVDREEFVNAGVILFCKEHRFLMARVAQMAERIRTLWPGCETGVIQGHLKAMERICDGDPEAGPIAQLSQRERFHWLVAPRSTVVQVSPVHTGICQDPQAMLESLFKQLVAVDI